MTSVTRLGAGDVPDGGSLVVSIEEIGRNVIIRVSDKGVGIREKDLARLLTPFFTTKVRGLGMGLAIYQRPVEAHGGDINIESVEWRGTTATVVLPSCGSPV